MAKREPKPAPDDDTRTPPGRQPERLKIEGDWRDAVRKALNTPPPPGGWPRPAARTTRRKGRPDA